MNNLPPLVCAAREGVIITPIQPSMLMYVNLYSTDENADEKFLYNYAEVFIFCPNYSVSMVWGGRKSWAARQYAMRIWLKPDRMRSSYNVSTDEVMPDAVGEQSVIRRPGRLWQSSVKDTSIAGIWRAHIRRTIQ